MRLTAARLGLLAPQIEKLQTQLEREKQSNQDLETLSADKARQVGPLGMDACPGTPACRRESSPGCSHFPGVCRGNAGDQACGLAAAQTSCSCSVVGVGVPPTWQGHWQRLRWVS